jgi:2-keto-4-pentenoate hydratase/2-oxohepta-3-ene-1,7-dioic acid hydratase in catechol pathway
MKLMSYEKDGQTSFGLAREDGVVDLAGRLDPAHQRIQDILGADIVARLKQFETAPIDHKFEDIRFLPPIPRPDRLICIGLNYKTHVDEARRVRGPMIDTPTYPMVFFRNPASQVGHREEIVRPKVSEQYDFEGEVAVIIGRGGRHIPAEQALEHVAGYSCYNDGSIRDYQRHSTQWGPGKNFDRSGSFGPWIMTSDEIPDPTKMVLITRLNGEEMQHASVGDLIFDVPALIAYCSTVMTLVPGDVIVSGTTGGVGGARVPPVWLKPGDTLEVEVQPVGVLRNDVVAEAE